ncbi:MAG: hypothetical protein HQL41_07005 [Alphaproteobacteria bacterium]|nr:hypothetical protein [Alphaproteobacteria bacterium]
MTRDLSALAWRHLARVTIAFRTPFVVRSGRGEIGVDSVFVRDANGFPALPGSSIAGVLRAACQSAWGKPFTEDLFGSEEGASRLVVGWGCVHDADDRPVEGLRDGDDPVLAAARRGVRRDHVGLDHRGTAQERRKFDERIVGVGHRFTFELVLSSASGSDDGFDRLLGLLGSGELRLGAGGRRGFGAFELARLRQRSFDLKRREDFLAYHGLTADLGAGDLDDRGPPEAPTPKRVVVTLRNLRPVDRWMFGGGTASGDEDMAPVTEPMIIWKDGRGHVSDDPVIYLPASGIKGALRQRVAWHFNLRAGRRSDSVAALGEILSDNPARTALFGEMASRDGGRPGRLLFDDVFILAAPAAQIDWHVSLDRFHGGARAGLLFSERVLVGGGGTDCRIAIDPDETLDAPTRRALAAALDDVRRGRVLFGGGTGRGNGAFICDAVEWSDGGRWLEAGST